MRRSSWCGIRNGRLSGSAKTRASSLVSTSRCSRPSKKGRISGPPSQLNSSSITELSIHVTPGVHAAALGVLQESFANLLQGSHNLHAFVQIVRSIFEQAF